MSDRLPSGSTTSNNSVPRRLTVDITINERPSNGCRSRRIVTEREMSWRWVVCGNFLRYDPARSADGAGGRDDQRRARPDADRRFSQARDHVGHGALASDDGNAPRGGPFAIAGQHLSAPTRPPDGAERAADGALRR